MNVKLPDDQTLWFRNLPPKEIGEESEGVQESAEKAPEVELFIEPLTPMWHRKVGLDTRVPLSGATVNGSRQKGGIGKGSALRS